MTKILIDYVHLYPFYILFIFQQIKRALNISLIYMILTDKNVIQFESQLAFSLEASHLP